ncbi:MAG: methylated-DNA--[protein]-cysteine S-methyltransferase [Rickettsiales bacterium]|nr:methylated-DNA--[protein]-cysteine S-methyltransferase [Rickettsiales bacterium]
MRENMYYSTTYSSPLGAYMLACDGASLVGLWLEGQKYYGNSVPANMEKKGGMPVFAAAKDWLDRYFAGEKPVASELPLAPIGGGFRRSVWDILCEIPYGEVMTYGEIAKKVAARLDKKSMAGQAVGNAVGHNPISIIIPCHRVVGTNGSLTGYAGGVETKMKLLELEGVDISRLSVPAKGTAL